MTLRRAVEAAGMMEHCDFDEQKSAATDDGVLRPDMIVHLPGGGEVVIDSKVPLDAFLQFSEADDEQQRRALLEKHARQLRTHVDQLAKKEYWKAVRAVARIRRWHSSRASRCWRRPARPTRRCRTMRSARRIVLATPNTLVAALRTIALSWQQETLAENAREVQQLGAELYERLRSMTGHMQSLQRSLTSSVEAYNKAVGSLETRVLVSARKFPGLGVVGSESAEIAELSPIEAAPRHLQAVEMLSDEDEGVGVGEPNILALPEGGGARGSSA